ncbi:MAG: hypothetical protein HQM09_12325 [Candidatus Riflebacteria bacterium]|nr:hypothetical protein [Candidatus Riflebacteria bacterium]
MNPAFRSRDKHQCSRLPGFTMVEIMMTVLLFSMISGMFFLVISQWRRSAQPTISDRLALQADSIRAADILIDHVREGLELVRPNLAETSPYLVMRDIVNNFEVLYLEADTEESKRCNKLIYSLYSVINDFSGKAPMSTRKRLFGGIERLVFTCHSPNSVQIELTMANTKGRFQFISQVGLLNFGSLE